MAMAMSHGALPYDSMMGSSDGFVSSSPSRRKKECTIGTKGMYEVTTGACLTYATPNATGTPLCAIKAGVRFHGVPYTWGSGMTKKQWIQLHTEDVPPPLLCFGKEAGLKQGYEDPIRAHVPKRGIDAQSLTLGNAV